MKRLFVSASPFPLVAVVSVAALAACGNASGEGQLNDVFGPGGSSAAGGTGDGGASGGSSTGSGTGSGSGGTGSGAGVAVDGAAPVVTDPFASLKSGANQMAAFCSRGSTDAASVALCKAPAINGLTDLQSALGLGFAHPNGTNGFNGNPAFVLMGHSASLGIGSISAANPRVVMMTAPSAWVPATNPAMNGDGMGPPPGWEPPSTGWTQPASWTPPTITGTMASWPPWDWSCTPTVAIAARGSLLDSPIHTFYGDDDDDDDGPTCSPTTVSNPTPPSAVALGFTRGTGIVEVAAAEPTTGNLHFIAVHYTTTPTASDADAGIADAGTSSANYGASSETNWTSWTAYDDSDLADTTMDCTHCHQPGGASTAKQLRMNETGTPWTHTMSSWTAGGQALLSDFHSVHGTTEAYGGIPSTMIDKSEPMTLQLASGCDGCTKQPIAFDSASIEQEVASSAPGQPALNTTPGTSATWTKLYNQGLAAHIVVPYHDVKVTDPTALQTAAATYQATGNADMSNLLSADAKTATLITPPPTMDGPTLLQAACADCHNSNVPTTLVRGQFDATNLAGMSRAMKDTAMARIQLTSVDVHHMPPESMHHLTANQVQILKAVLEQ